MKQARFLVWAILWGLAACGDDTRTELRRLPQAPDVAETVIPGQIFTRGPGGAVVARATYASQEDVHLVGTGLPDGSYYFQITGPGCMLLLAGPEPASRGVPDTSGREIEVNDGVFGPVALAPFLTTPDEDGFYEVYLTAREDFDPSRGCFGFLGETSVQSGFIVEPAVQPVTDGTQP